MKLEGYGNFQLHLGHTLTPSRDAHSGVPPVNCCAWQDIGNSPAAEGLCGIHGSQ